MGNMLIRKVCRMSKSDNGSAEMGKRKRGPPPKLFSAWQPGDVAMQSQRKRKQRSKEERAKEASRVAKYREAKKESGEASLTKENTK